MSTINTSSAGAANTTAASGASSLASMTGTDFLKLMTTELSNQDPENPMSSTDLMQEMSTVYSLESNQQMMQNQGMTSALLLMGSTISGSDASGNAVKGQVSGITVDSSGTVNLTVQETSGSTTTQASMPLNNVTSVAAYTASNTGS